MADAPKISPNLPRMIDNTLGSHRVTHDGRATGAHDSGFFTTNRFPVRPQVLDVINIDAGDDGAVGINDVGRIQTPAQTDLQDGDIQQGMAHQPQNRQGREFKVGERYLTSAHRASGFYRLKMGQQIVGPHDFPVDTTPLLEMNQVG